VTVTLDDQPDELSGYARRILHDDDVAEWTRNRLGWRHRLDCERAVGPTG
jgi:hypothetical protein